MELELGEIGKSTERRRFRTRDVADVRFLGSVRGSVLENRERNNLVTQSPHRLDVVGSELQPPTNFRSPKNRQLDQLSSALHQLM